MKYTIKTLVLGRFADLEISEEEFSSLKAAQHTLIQNVDIEQRYDILVENYLDIERTLLREATEYAIRPGSYTSVNFRTLSAPVDRVVTNYLASARAYVDHISKGQSEENKDAISVILRDAYDESLAYRTMEALRNYVQHSGLPTHTLTLGGEWVGRVDENSGYRTEKLSPSLKLPLLRVDKQFKRGVLNELVEKYGDECEIMPLIRKYQASLSGVNLKVRSQSQEREQASKALLSKTCDRYINLDGNSRAVGIAAVAVNEDQTIEEIYLSFGVEDTLEFYRQRNRELVNLDRLRFTS